MNKSLETLLIIAFLIVILWNLGAGLYYMMVDKGTTDRTVKAYVPFPPPGVSGGTGTEGRR